MASGIRGSLRLGIVGLLSTHHARPNTKFRIVPHKLNLTTGKSGLILDLVIAVLSDPGEFGHRMCPVARCRRGLRRDLSGSALPKFPQSVSRGARLSRLHWFATATACQVARPPGLI